MKQISIVVPMYNVASYIKRCLNSCFTQDLAEEEYEIIIVNDGSTDDSLTIATDFIKVHSNARIISQPNGGLSNARNTGIDNAVGEYVFFVDSDDWIESNCLKKIIRTCKRGNLDILRICAANIIDNKVVRRNSYKEDEINRGIDVLKKGVVYCAPFSIYRRGFLNNYALRFYPGIYHEDNEFTPRAYYFAEYVSSVNDIIYYVYQNPESITRKPNPKKAFDVIHVMESLRNFSSNMSDDEKKIFNNQISSSMNAALNETYSMRKEDNKRFSMSLYEHKHLFEHLKHSTSLQFKIEGYLFSLFPHHAVSVYHLLRLFDYRKLKTR